MDSFPKNFLFSWIGQYFYFFPNINFLLKIGLFEYYDEQEKKKKTEKKE